jgi:hypothetical protein
MTTSPLLRASLLAAALVTSACAGSHRAPETQADARLRDSAPEKIAAQRAATPALALEAEDQRWGIGAARERQRRADDQRAASAARAAARGAGTVDLAPGMHQQ